MSWDVEPSSWLTEPGHEPGDTYPADPLDRQVVAATTDMPEGMIVPSTPQAAVSGEFQSAPVAEAEGSMSQLSEPEVGAPAPAPFTETLDIQLQAPEAPVVEPPPPTPSVEPMAQVVAQAPAPAPTPVVHSEPLMQAEPPRATPARAPELEVKLHPNPDAPVVPDPPGATPVAVEPPPPTPAAPSDDAPVGLFTPTLTAAEPEPAAAQEFEAPAPVPRETPAASSEELEVEVEEVEELDELEEVTEEVAESPAPGAPPAPAPPAPPKAKRRHWGDEVFKEHILATLPPDADAAAEADVAFLERALELEAPCRILDVGCGNGRHAFAFANRGHQVVGVDNSLDMLLAAGKRNEGREHSVNFLRSDMRELPQDAQYDLVCCLGSSFGYYEDEVNRSILDGLRKVLAPGGRLVLQVFNRDYMAARVPCRSWWQGPGCMVLDEVEMNYFANRLRVHRTIVFEDGRQFDHYLFLKAFTLHEIGKTLSSIGMRVREVSGSRDTRGRFYGGESPDIWVTAEVKPES